MNLRHYQSEDLERIFTQWDSVGSTLYTAATGLGKTVLFSQVAQRFLPARTLVLVHREELLTQSAKTFARIGITVGVEKAEQTVHGTAFFEKPNVVVASVQTLLSGGEGNRRFKQFRPDEFGLLILDEAHHYPAKSWRQALDYFRNGNPSLKILGVTATPDRADEEALGQLFDTVASERNLLWAIDNGWLVPVQQQFVSCSELDFSHVKTTAGDLNLRQLADVMEAESSVQSVVQPTLESLFKLEPNALGQLPVEQWTDRLNAVPESHRRRGIVFTVSVKQAEMLAAIFNRVMPGLAGWICGKTPEDERRSLLRSFVDSPMRLMVNVGVLTEGFDNPNVDLIIGARPTKSRSLYAQMIGRATRPLPGLLEHLPDAASRIDAIAASAKPVCTVIDFVGNSGRHKLITTADILGGKVSEEAHRLALKKAKGDGKPVDMRQLLAEEEERIKQAILEAKQREEARRAKLVAKVRTQVRTVDPFSAFGLRPAPRSIWNQGKTLSEKQKAILLKNGIDPDSMNYDDAKQLLNTMFDRWSKKLATYKQCALLKRYGYDPSFMTMEQATATIDGLARNGWQRKREAI